jgi:hypothetical protein
MRRGLSLKFGGNDAVFFRKEKKGGDDSCKCLLL